MSNIDIFILLHYKGFSQASQKIKNHDSLTHIGAATKVQGIIVDV